MARTRPDTGAISLSGLLNISAVVFLTCLLFLIIDVRHRMTGYDAVNGKGVQGTVTVTKCHSDRISTFCTGEFVSADGRIRRSGIRVNGATELLERAGQGHRLTAPVHYPAAVSDAKADEAWTLDGKPWMRLSTAQVIALVPVVVPVVLLWVLMRGGPISRRQRINQARTLRSRRSQRRQVARLRQTRRGRVH